MRLFLCGDVMTGRGIDQILPHSCTPRLYESAADSALDYVRLAEQHNGAIPRMADPAYIWGDAHAVLAEHALDARIINLETSITTSEHPYPKGINYRMHPANVSVLQAAAINCCSLANNHVLDWGKSGLVETADTLTGAGIAVTGAGCDHRAAVAPARLPLDSGQAVLVFGCGTTDSGIPSAWAATDTRPGVHLLTDLSDAMADHVSAIVHEHKQPGDIAILSIHWGSNWGYDIHPDHRRFAHALIDRAAIDLIHGHSSHHPIGMEVHRNRLILYGCGDFINDYEGIRGYEEFRADLVLMYFPTIDAVTGELVRLELQPMQLRRFRLNQPTVADRTWLLQTLDRECERLGQRLLLDGDRLVLAGD